MPDDKSWYGLHCPTCGHRYIGSANPGAIQLGYDPLKKQVCPNDGSEPDLIVGPFPNRAIAEDMIAQEKEDD